MIYANEALTLIKTLSLYKTLDERQVFKLFPGKESAVQSIITGYVKQKRLTYDAYSGLISMGSEMEPNPDFSLITSFWVLLDFIHRAVYHSTGEYPVKICFFSVEGDYYEIINVPPENEVIINHALSSRADEPGRRIIIVGGKKQISNIHINGVVSFCTVAGDGKVNYFKKGGS